MRRGSNSRAKLNKKRLKAKEAKKTKKQITSLSIFVIALFVILIIVACFYSIKHYSNYNNLVLSSQKEIDKEKKLAEKNTKKEPKPKETDTTFTLSAIGDIMCHNTQYMDAYNKETDSYDFSYVFENISYYTKLADICVGSLETTFAGKERGFRSYPTFNTPDELAFELKSIGVDVLSTSGNHALDMGFDGLCRTIDVLDEADIAHTGTYKTAEDQNKILFKYVKGIKIAFINYTYGTNGINVPKGKEFAVNYIDKDLIKKHIDLAKQEKADMIVACMHWGNEYKTKQNKTQEELTDFLFQNGVDIILGNHPHVLEPMEKRQVTLADGTNKDCFVIYALGNFIADQNATNTRNSVILNLKITKHTDGKITIDEADYVPIYMYKDPSLKLKKMKLLDIEKEIFNYENYSDNAVSDKLYNTLKNELNSITKILGEKIS